MGNPNPGFTNIRPINPEFTNIRPIDITSGLVPKRGDVDISAGLVPRNQWKPVDEEAELKSKWKPVDEGAQNPRRAGGRVTITPDSPNVTITPDPRWEPVDEQAQGVTITPDKPDMSQTSLVHQAIALLKDVGIGALKGAGNTVAGVSSLLGKTPYLGRYLAPPEGVRALRSMTEPTNLPQKVGYYGEQGAEFLLPGEAEDAVAVKLAEHAPQLGRLALPAGKVATEALSSGVVNKLQGGGFGTGALAGAGGAALGQVASRLAPPVMRSALGVTPRQLRYGVTPGEEALQLPGLTRRGIINSAENKLEQLTPQLDRMVQNAPTPVSLQPAHDVIDRAIVDAKKTNSKPVVSALKDLREQLTNDLETGKPIGISVSPDKARALKQGLETHFEQTTAGRKVRNATREAYHAIDQQLDQAIPGHEALNRQISSLIVAAHPQGSGEMFMRGVRPVVAMMGARTLGGGLPGALALHTATSPTGRVVLAKTLKNAPQIARLGRAALLGAGNAER